MKLTFLAITFFISAGFLGAISHASPSFSEIQIAKAGNESLRSAVKSIKQRTGGRILSTKTVKKKGQIIYKIKVLLPSGRVKTFIIKAK